MAPCILGAEVAGLFFIASVIFTLSCISILTLELVLYINFMTERNFSDRVCWTFTRDDRSKNGVPRPPQFFPDKKLEGDRKFQNNKLGLEICQFASSSEKVLASGKYNVIYQISSNTVRRPINNLQRATTQS